MAKQDVFFNFISKDRDTFLFFVNECNRLYRAGHDRELYREIIALHRANHEDLYSEDKLYALIHETLVAWNMDQRGANLQNASVIRDSAKAVRGYMVDASQFTMESLNGTLNDGVSFLLEKIFLNLQIMDNKRRLVGVSKAMHFLLPDLVMPIDNTYTLRFFLSPQWNSETPSKAFDAFKHIHRKACRLVHDLKISARDVNGDKWNTSVPKLIDNAMIGFFKHHGL